MRTLIVIFSSLIIITSCIKPADDDKLPDTFLNSNGLFIVNEGNFRQGNGSLSYYSYDSLKIFNDIFGKINNRILGDVPNSIEIHNNFAYIVVNNSGKIEVVDKYSFMSVATISGLNSPRRIAFNNNKAYVTSMYSDSLTILDLNSFSVTGHINLRRTSESIVIIDNKAYVSEWIGGNEIMVINTLRDKVTDSIQVGIEPESMVPDKNENIWVLCNGGWQRNNNAELISISTITNTINKRLIFSDRFASPSCLQINGSGDKLYYIENGIKSLSIYENALPANSLIPDNTYSFYKMGVNPVNNDIFITDAADYQQRGKLKRYSAEGVFHSEYQVDIIPGLMLFKMEEK